MNLFEQPEFAEFSDRVATVLGHSLWQAPLLAILLVTCLRFIPARRGNLRYGVSLLTMSFVVLLIFATWSLTGPEEHPAAAEVFTPAGGSPTELTGEPAGSGSQQVSDASADPVAVRQAAADTQSPAAVLVISWLLGTCLMLARSLYSVFRVRRWVAAAEPLSEDDRFLVELAQTTAAALGLRCRVRLVPCVEVTTPAVFGVLFPVLLIPPALVRSLTQEQWRIILAHEFAHVRRLDAMVNLLQMTLESLLFFNPAVWWISRLIRQERESCCDHVAAELTGRSAHVARTILDVAEAVSPGTPGRPPGELRRTVLTFAVSAASQLRDRIQRLVRPDEAGTPGLSVRSAVTTICIAAVVLLMLQQATNLAVVSAAPVL